MNVNHYIGLDVHKKSVSYCVKLADGQIVEEGKLRATHEALRQWAGKRQEPWHGAMEVTLFSGCYCGKPLFARQGVYRKAETTANPDFPIRLCQPGVDFSARVRSCPF